MRIILILKLIIYRVIKTILKTKPLNLVFTYIAYVTE